jgi:hypothetical protein
MAVKGSIKNKASWGFQKAEKKNEVRATGFGLPRGGLAAIKKKASWFCQKAEKRMRRAGDGIRTREYQLGRLMPYHLATPACVCQCDCDYSINPKAIVNPVLPADHPALPGGGITLHLLVNGGDFSPVGIAKIVISHQTQQFAHLYGLINIIGLRLDINDPFIRGWKGHEGMPDFRGSKVDGNDPGVDILFVGVGRQIEGKVHAFVLALDILVQIGGVVGHERLQLFPCDGVIRWGDGAGRERGQGRPRQLDGR